MRIRPGFFYGVGEFANALKRKDVPVAKAATAAVREVGEKAKIDARLAIASAGFSERWQNAMRVDFFPKSGGESINAAAWVYHKIPYAGVFENAPTTIRGKMWIPTPWAPKKIGRMKMTPDHYLAATNQRLFPIKSGRRTYLATTVDANSATAARLPKKWSATAIKRGRTGQKAQRARVTVPLFVSVDSVSIKKKLNILAVVNRAADQLAAAYLRHFDGG